MRSLDVDQRTDVYGAPRLGGAIAAYYAQQLAWAHLPAPAQRFIAVLDKRMGKRRRRVPPARSADGFADDPRLVMPADRLARIVDDRCGESSRAVTAAEISSALEGDWVVHRWMRDVQRASGAPLDDLVAIALDHWIGFGQPLIAEPWFHLIGDIDPDTGRLVAWRTLRHYTRVPAGPAGELASLLVELHGARVMARGARRFEVALPGMDIELVVAADDRSVILRTLVGERHPRSEDIESLARLMRDERGLGDHLSISRSNFGWEVWFDTTIEVADHDPDELHARMWEFLQIANELRPPFTP